MSVKEVLNDLLDVLADPSLSEPARTVWAVASDELDNLPNPVPENAAQVCRDALRPADGLGKPAQWTGRDWARAVGALAAWSRCKSLNGLGKSWIAKAGGSAPETHEAGTRELAGLLYRRLLEAVSPRGAADRLSGRQRALLLAAVCRVARELDVSPAEKVTDKRSLSETPDAYVADLIRHGLLERGGPGPASVVSDWPALLEDRARFRDSFWSELRELVEAPGKAVLPLTALGVALVALLVAFLISWGKSAKLRDDLETLGKAVREVASGSLKNNPDPTATELAAGLAEHAGLQARALDRKSGELTALTADVQRLRKEIADQGDSLKAAGAVREGLEKNLAAARKERDAAQAEVEKRSAALKEASAVLAEREKTIKSTKADLDKAVGERDRLATDLKTSKDDLARSRDEVRTLTVKLDAAADAAKRNGTDLAKARDELKLADARLVNANDALRATTERLTAADKSATALKAELKQTQTKLSAATDAAAKAEAERTKALAELNKTRTELEKLSAQEKATVARLDDAQKQLATAQAERRKALSDLAGSKEKLSASEKDLAGVRTRLAATEKDLTGAREAAARSDAELVRVRKDLAAANLARAKSEAESIAARKELDNARKQGDGLRTENAGLKKEIAELKKEVADLKSRKPEPKEVRKPDDPVVKTKPEPKNGEVGKDAPKVDFLGALLRDLTPADRKALNLAADAKGVFIHEVKAGSKAAAAGLKPGEVVLELRADFLVGNMVLSQEARVGETAEAGAFAARVSALRRDNKFKCWHVKTAARTVVIED
jgi:predicted  nucleic acid-binding Zn-ribbon protein